MSESLNAACGQFEQIILAQMLRTAGIGRTTSDDAENGDDAFSQLVVVSLASAVERAGGLGLGSSLAKSVERGRP